jgi:hypothetical protein
MVIACCRSLSRCQTCMFVAVAVAIRRNSYEECLISRILTSSYSPFRTYLFHAITSTPVYHTFLTSNTTWTENHVDQGSYPKKLRLDAKSPKAKACHTSARPKGLRNFPDSSTASGSSMLGMKTAEQPRSSVSRKASAPHPTESFTRSVQSCGLTFCLPGHGALFRRSDCTTTIMRRSIRSNFGSQISMTAPCKSPLEYFAFSL